MTSNRNVVLLVGGVGGAKLAYGLSSSTFVELSYMRTDTEGQFFPYGIGSPGELESFSSNWIQIGGLQSMNLGRIDPFGTITAGLTVWSPKTSGRSSYTHTFTTRSTWCQPGRDHE